MRRPLMPPQLPLFEFRKEGDSSATPRPMTPGCLLPVPIDQEIDMRRACAILGATEHTVRRLQKNGEISGYQLGSRGPWHRKLTYASIVDFCDRLRVKNGIKDRRPRLRGGQRRWADADLLPFPISDTVSVKDAMTGLDISAMAVLRLIEEGRFEAYQLLKDAPWRISRSSLLAYSDSLTSQLAGPGRRK